MRILSFFGLVMGAIAIFLALYLHFEIAPNAEYAESVALEEKSADYVNSSEGLDDQLLDGVYATALRTLFGLLALIFGGIAFLVSIFPAIKRNKFAIVGGVLGLVAFFIGAAYGTHMFS